MAQKNELEKCKYQRTGFKRYLWWKIHFILPDIKVSLYFKWDKFPKMGWRQFPPLSIILCLLSCSSIISLFPKYFLPLPSASTRDPQICLLSSEYIFLLSIYFSKRIFLKYFLAFFKAFSGTRILKIARKKLSDKMRNN